MTTESNIEKTPGDTALASPARMAAFDHLDADDFSMPCLHLNQGSGSERQRYGDHPAGAWIHTLSKQDTAGTTFAYVLCTSEKVVWWRMDHPTEKGIHSRYPKGTPVPAVVLDNPDISVIDTKSLYVLLDGESIPAVIRLKKTALTALRALNSLERSRALAGQPVGTYRLESDDQSNDAFQWKVPLFVPVGDADAATMERVAACQQMLLTSVVRIADDAGVTEHTPPGQSSLATVKLSDVKPLDDEDIPF